jgi:hypothetical protein
MKHAMLRQPDGTVTEVHFAFDHDMQAVEAYRDKVFPGSEILGDVPPPSYRFRDCWRVSSGAVSVDMPLARQQRLAEIRAERNEKFARLDAEWMRATGQKRTAEADAIEAKRQTLRDIPATAQTALESCKSTDDLESYQPEWPE